MEWVKEVVAGAARGLQFRGRFVPEAARRMRRLVRGQGLEAFSELLAILDLLGRSRAGRPLASAPYVPRLGQNTGLACRTTRAPSDRIASILTAGAPDET